MSEIRFYHLQKQSLDQVLPQILLKVVNTDRRAVVKMPDNKEVEKMNSHLWTYRPDQFLPHGSKKDGYEEDQPIWLTNIDENPNGSAVLILTGGSVSEKMDDYDLVCEMLDGHDHDSIKDARDRWKLYKEQGHDVTYWHQSETGSWDKKA